MFEVQLKIYIFFFKVFEYIYTYIYIYIYIFTRQCSRSVYAFEWSSLFFKPQFSADVSVFLCFSNLCGTKSFSFFFFFNHYLPAILYRYNLIAIRLLALHYRSNWKLVFLAKPYMEPICYYVYKFYYVECLSNIGFLLVFSSVVFYFLMRRPTMCFISMIVSLIFLFVT